MEMKSGGKMMHIVMFPWFAMGHLTAFLHTANKFAERGHRVSFLIPSKTQSKLTSFNLHPSLISFILLEVPRVDGLPSHAQTTADIPYPLYTHLMTAMDRTEPTIESILLDLKPDLVFYDFTHWLPTLARRLGIKSIHYCIISPATIAYDMSPARDQESELNLELPPKGFPPSSVKLRSFEAKAGAAFRNIEYGSGVSFHDRMMISLRDGDALVFKACREMEGEFCDYLEKQFKKPVLASGPVIPETPTSTLDEKWDKWLGGFKKGSVVYCALGSQSNLNKDQFQELVLGLELTGLPFLAALKPPAGNNSVEEVLPEGFTDRVKGRGFVEGGWIQQQLILSHPSIGCFVTHCGSGSITEALVNECQIVLLPQIGDQIVNARSLAGDLKAGVEVERREEDCWFTKESICNAVKLVMEENGEVANEVRLNHDKWRKLLLKDNLESSYTDEFINKLQDIIATISLLGNSFYWSIWFCGQFKEIMAMNGGGKMLHIVMYPWFAMGHLTAFLHASNKLAAKGHRVSFIIPTKTQSKLSSFNLHPSLISFIPLDVPRVEGLIPSDAETTADVPFPLHTHLMTAMDCTENTVESILRDLKPDFIFFDFTHWIPAMARRLGIKSIHYCIISPATIAYTTTPERDQESELNLEHPPLGFPPSAVKLRSYEAKANVSFRKKVLGSGVSFHNRMMTALNECDAMAFKACREMEGAFCDYLERQFKKPVLLSGPVIPETPTSTLDEKWQEWLGRFKKGSVVYCALGSQSNLNKHQFQELVLGLELTGLPFLAALKPPTGNSSVEEVLPEGFTDRAKGRGIVEGGWIQQQLILSHPSIGCFVTHCGSGSITEALANDCQIVLFPQIGDQIVNARLMAGDLKVGVEVERGDEDGSFTKQSICNAVRLVMDEKGEVANEVRLNHAKWKEFLLKDNLESSYTDEFITKLQGLL
ncbi:hypothetical protein MKW98_010786 [Papaver atlanticum]|uniref:Uncharacterized protein n=1 Tax=Papaver atlanticum TaxID=357466 RepID=A0AAD4XIL7_9MAGN|nr:hypothetical protein MKW98_010786 [Papaver atlanticum]